MNQNKMINQVTVFLFSTCPNPARSCAPLKAKDTSWNSAGRWWAPTRRRRPPLRPLRRWRRAAPRAGPSWPRLPPASPRILPRLRRRPRPAPAAPPLISAAGSWRRTCALFRTYKQITFKHLVEILYDSSSCPIMSIRYHVPPINFFLLDVSEILIIISFFPFQ